MPLVYHDKVCLFTSHDEDDAQGFQMFDDASQAAIEREAAKKKPPPQMNKEFKPSKPSNGKPPPYATNRSQTAPAATPGQRGVGGREVFLSSDTVTQCAGLPHLWFQWRMQ